MQAASSSKQQKPSKFIEGRLKLSTSCTECHRRKQKCDQKQPCKHCARRFPQPACIYRSIKDLSLSSNVSNASSHSGNEQELPARAPLSGSDPNKGNGKQSLISPGFNVEDVVQIDQQDVKAKAGRQISPDSLNPAEYQRLVAAMINNIGEEIESDQEAAAHFAGYQGLIHSASMGLIPVPRLQRGSQVLSVVGPPSRFSITSVDPLHFLGVLPTYQSGELLQAFLKIITRYVVSIDGSVRPNYYNDTWVPWCMKSPLLTHLAIFTASCYQSESQRIPPPQSAVVLGYKLKSIRLLNEMLRNKETATCTEAITAVGYLCTNEWYWSNYENVKAHLKGLREMIRLRGGLGELGHDGFQRNMVILIDYQISCSYEIELSFPHNTATHVRYPAPMSCPLLYSLVNFSSIYEQIGITAETATILDQMRFVTMSAIALVDSAQSTEELDKISTATRSIQAKISSLPDGTDPSSPFSKDFIYRSCRMAALIYCRAVIERVPMSKACSVQDLNQLWSCMWRVTLTEWKTIPGIFVWIILAGNPAAQVTPHGRFLKSMLKAATSYMALDFFDVVDCSLMNYAKLQRWLRVERNDVLVLTNRGKTRDLAYLQHYK